MLIFSLLTVHNGVYKADFKKVQGKCKVIACFSLYFLHTNILASVDEEQGLIMSIHSRIIKVFFLSSSNSYIEVVLSWSKWTNRSIVI
jgi:hypothetical protein